MTETLLALLTPLGPYALLLLAAVAFAETALLIGVMLPADTLLVTAGVLVAAGALQLPLWLWLVAVALAAVAGDQVAYLVGKRLAPRLRHGQGSRLATPQRLEQGRSLFDRHGAKAVVLARFVPVARTLTPVVAGMSGMNRRTFLAYNIVGALAWTAVMFGGGYWLGAVPFIASNLDAILLAVVAISVLPAIATWVRARTPHTQTA